MTTVFFEDVGLKKFNLSLAKFVRVEGEEAVSDYLTALVAYHKKTEKSGLTKKQGHATFEKAVENFRSFFPRGFQDPAYLSGLQSEREQKVRAHECLVETLAQDVLAQLLSERNYTEICSRAKSIANKTNLIHQHEKILLTNALADDTAKEKFSIALAKLLYGEEQPQARFEQFFSTLYEINAAKWPIATYFSFLAAPDRQIFVKPQVTKSAAEVLGIDINYRPDLNWLTYSQVQRLAEALRKKLVEQGQEEFTPRDMIDVQSFIWVTAPGYV